MAKRFIDTERHRKDLRGVDCKIRLAHEWLWQNCDAAGVWATDPDLFKFECGYALNVEALLKACPWVRQLPNGAIFITDFIEVNYGTLKDGYNPHKPVYRSLKANGIDLENGEIQDLPNPCLRVEEEGEEEDTTQERKERVREPRIIPLDMSEQMAAAIARWEQHRVEKRNKLTPSTREAFLKKCKAWGDLRAIAAIDHSIAQGWTGCYEPSQTTSNAQETDEQRRAERNRIIAERYPRG